MLRMSLRLVLVLVLRLMMMFRLSRKTSGGNSCSR